MSDENEVELTEEQKEAINSIVHVSSYIGLPFDIDNVVMKANGWLATCAEQGAYGTRPPAIYIDEGTFEAYKEPLVIRSDMELSHAFRRFIVGKFAPLWEAMKVTPEVAHAATVQAIKANEALEAITKEAAKVELAMIEMREKTREAEEFKLAQYAEGEALAARNALAALELKQVEMALEVKRASLAPPAPPPSEQEASPSREE